MKMNQVSAWALLLLAAVAQGCDANSAKKPAPAPDAAAAPAAVAAAPDAVAASAATQPAAVGATSAEDFDPATDPVLGWWRSSLDVNDDRKVSFLWPDNPDDSRALRTLRFLNDGMATNGCCAGAEWTFAAPKFYKVDRQVHELYYLASPGELYFLARTEAEKSAPLFKKIIEEITAGKTPESLATSGLLEAPSKFVRTATR